MKRILLFLATNLAIIVVISAILSIFNVQPYLTTYGLDYKMLLIYALIIGFTGSFISLFISKWMAIHGFGIQLIKTPRNETERWLIAKVRQLANRLQIGMPEVGIYNSPEPNAFATGWNRNHALMAVSTGILSLMDEDQLEGVLGHELSHIANGDMVTLTLIQGVVNTFVIFFARIAAFFVSQLLRRDDNMQSGGFVYYGVVILFEIIFGILASLIVLWFSRHREYKADAGSAHLLGKTKMIEALKRLQQVVDKAPVDNRAPAFNNFKISNPPTWAHLFSSHPPLQNRIRVLEKTTDRNII